MENQRLIENGDQELITPKLTASWEELIKRQLEEIEKGDIKKQEEIVL